jgi:MFS family permease
VTALQTPLRLGLRANAGQFVLLAAVNALVGGMVGQERAVLPLLADEAFVAHPSWRPSAVGVYRFWRDLGFAAGALLAGWVADLAGIEAAIYTVAGVTALSAVIVAVRMYETHPRGH